MTTTILRGDCRQTMARVQMDRSYVMEPRDPKGRFIGGVSYSPGTQFQPGQHWRERKPFWDKAWLENEYTTKLRSAAEIAAEFGVRPSAICFWLNKHGIRTRSTREVRAIKKWGSSGPANWMYGRTGARAPSWRGGHTPWRLAVYTTTEWRRTSSLVRRRDNSVCRLCGDAKRLELHHIERVCDAPLLVFDPNNIVTLCYACHKRIRGKERRWRKRLLKLIGSQQ